MISFVLIFIFSLIGIAETIYLISKRTASKKVICPVRGNCEKVLSSKYNKIFFVPNDVLGFLTYISISFISIFLMFGFQPITFWNLIIKIIIGGATIMSFFLTYIQWRIIKAWCFWCLMSAFTIWFMAITLFLIQF